MEIVILLMNKHEPTYYPTMPAKRRINFRKHIVVARARGQTAKTEQ